MIPQNDGLVKGLVSVETKQQDQAPEATRAYRTPELFVIGSAVELVQGWRGAYADGAGHMFRY